MRHKLNMIAIGLLCLFQAACGCFCYTGARWGITPTVPYHMSSAALFPANFEREFDQAALTWTLASAGTFRFVNSGAVPNGFSGTPDGVNVVDFLWLGFLPENPLAITALIDLDFFNCLILEIDVVYNSVPPGGTYDSSGVPQPGMYDIQTIALHELGHELQLGHVGCPDDSIMLESYRQISQNFARVRHGLDGCDIVGINTIYLAQAPPCLPLGGFCFFSFFLPFSTAEGEQVALNEEYSTMAQTNQEEVTQIAVNDPVIVAEATELSIAYEPYFQMWLRKDPAVVDKKVTGEDVKKAERVLHRLHANGSRQLRDDVDKVKKRIKDMEGRPVSELFESSLVKFKAPKKDKE
jgi:hypothetical protein